MSKNTVVESKTGEIDPEIRVTKVEKDSNPNLYRFTLENTHVSYANTLRRLMMTGVETIAFNADMKNGTTSDVTILLNDTPMTHEMFAHRMGLLPITVKSPTTFKSEDYTFTLNVTGKPDEMVDVTCSDFVITKAPVSEGKEPTIIPTEEFFPKHPISKSTCLIATLPTGATRIHAIAKASFSNGRLNARYQPTSQCSYTYTLDEDPVRRQEYFDRWLRDVKSYRDVDKESEKYKAYQREFNTMEINRIYKRRANGEPYSFDFIVETIGTLEVPYIIQRACDYGMGMMSRYININTAGFDMKANGITIQPSISNTFGIDFIIERQDHTLGNMIQTYLSENHMADKVVKGSGIQKIVYVGYEIPHQLRDEMVLRIGLDTDSKDIEQDARNAFAQASEGCYDILMKIRGAFVGTPLERKVEGFTFEAKKPSLNATASASASASASGTATAKSKTPLSKSKVITLAEAKP